MAFFQTAVTGLTTVVTAIGAGKRFYLIKSFLQGWSLERDIVYRHAFINVLYKM